MAASGGGRRSLDSEINMVPMIDLLICCITFLMLTAVWSTWGRMEATAQVGGGSGRIEEVRAKLHVMVETGTSFTLAWREGNAVLRTVSVPRETSRDGRYPALAEALRREWAGRPESAEGSAKPVAAVLHVDHTTRYAEMAAIMDAIQAPRLDETRRNSEGAFWVSLAN